MKNRTLQSAVARLILCSSCTMGWVTVASEGLAAEPPLRTVVEQAIGTAAKQYEWKLANLPVPDRMPRTFDHGELVMVREHDWTVGFFPGTLWRLYEITGQAKWRTAAERYTGLLEAEQFNTRTHDVGFIMNVSFGNGLRLTGNPAYRPILLKGAESLSTRFSATVGSIKSWDRSPAEYTFPVIIDNLMNLELLLWATRADGNARYQAMAIAHADTTLANHIRPDGSSFHVVDFDSATGRVLRRITHQGAADGSAWSRGVAWSLYGFTMMFRETREARYLEAAERIAQFVLDHPRLPEDKVPYWDFDAPGQPSAPRDSSAAAIMSAALFELAGFTPSPDGSRRYAALAERQLRSLASPDYLAAPGTNGGFLLKHATGNFPHNGEIDVPICYADYYFLEALIRAKATLGARELHVNSVEARPDGSTPAAIPPKLPLGG